MDFDGISLDALTDDQLEAQLVTWAGRVNAGQARLLALIGEINVRSAWSGDGWLSCTHWLTVKLGMGQATAYEHVRVAHALRELTLIADEMAAGRLSWTQVRAITRVSTVDTQQTWIDVARHASGAQLAKLARATERARANSDGCKPKPRLTQGYDEDGMMLITLRVPVETGTVVMTGIKAALEDLVREANDSPAGEPEASTPDPNLADAAVAMAKSYLAGRIATAKARDRIALRVFLDPLSGWARTVDGELLPPQVTERITKEQPAVPVPSKPLNLGRLHREATAHQRAVLEALDGARCAFPGCDRRKNLHAHHVIWFRNGGRTDLNNLVLLCSRHHTLTHEGVYLLKLLPDRALRVYSPKTGKLIGQPLPPVTENEPDRLLDGDIDARAAQSDYEATELDMAYAVSVLANL